MSNEQMTVSRSNVLAMAKIIEGCSKMRRVRWEGIGNVLLEGTLRSIGDTNGNFSVAEDDIRNAFVRITETSGFEHFMPMADAVRLIKQQLMAIEER